MRISRVTRFQELLPDLASWNQLAGDNPFRRWEWLEGWWRHYGPSDAQAAASELYLLVARHDDGHLLAVLPCYKQNTLAQGRQLQLLGGGEICSEYLGLLCEPPHVEAVCQQLADWLSAGLDREADRWDAIRLQAIHPQDQVTRQFAACLEPVGNLVACTEEFNTWRVELSPTWDEFLMVLSKQHRNRLRRWYKTYLATGQAISHRVQTLDDLNVAWPIFIDLHQRRRQSLGQPGCFASPRFAAFHRELAERFLAAGWLRLSWLEYHGRPIATEYHFGRGDVAYVYQAGLDPDAHEMHPGELITMAAMQNALTEGYRSFDFLRGDEPYKAHWRCQPTAMLQYKIVPPVASAKLRAGVCNAGANVKSWIKTGLSSVGLHAHE